MDGFCCEDQKEATGFIWYHFCKNWIGHNLRFRFSILKINGFLCSLRTSIFTVTLQPFFALSMAIHKKHVESQWHVVLLSAIQRKL